MRPFQIARDRRTASQSPDSFPIRRSTCRCLSCPCNFAARIHLSSAQRSRLRQNLADVMASHRSIAIARPRSLRRVNFNDKDGATRPSLSGKAEHQLLLSSQPSQPLDCLEPAMILLCCRRGAQRTRWLSKSPYGQIQPLARTPGLSDVWHPPRRASRRPPAALLTSAAGVERRNQARLYVQVVPPPWLSDGQAASRDESSQKRVTAKASRRGCTSCLPICFHRTTSGVR